MSDDLVNITFDGVPLSVPKGTLLIEAARQIHLEIPAYCYHPKMKPVGACRVCMVEVEGQRKPIMAACTTTVMPDMVVHTKSDDAIAAREGILEFLLINHPLDCPVCDRGGECDLQDFVLRYGPPKTRFVEQKRHFAKSKLIGPNVILDRERCIMCQRCTRFSEEIAMDKDGLVIIERGSRSEIGTFESRPYDSKFSGNVIELCPVGALTAKTYRFRARPWEQQHYAGISNTSSLGTNITVDVRFDKVVRFRSRMNDDIDDGWLTDECRYSHLPIHSEERVEQPMVRNSDGELEATSWEKALEVVAAKLSEENVKTAVLASSKLSVEDGHMLLRLGKSVLKTPHVVHQFEDEKLVTEHKLSGRVFGCDQADVIICLGCDPSVTHSELELRIKKGLRQRAKLVTLTQEPSMVGFADYQALGEPAKLWAQLIKAIKREAKEKEGGIQLPKPRPWEAGGSTSEDFSAIADLVRDAHKVLLVVAGNIETLGLKSLPAEVEKLGWSTAPHGLLHLRNGANSFGLDLVGLTSGSSHEKPDALASAWGTYDKNASRSYSDICQKPTDVLFSFGTDYLVQEKSKKPKFLIAASTYYSKTTEAADVVLPLSSWVESNGVFVSTDGTVQFNRQAILPVAASKPGWHIAKLLIEVLQEEKLDVSTAKLIYQEVGQLNAYFAGASYEDFRKPGAVHWSFPQQAPLGMPRPDLSAIPVTGPDTPMWMPVIPTGSKVENASLLRRGQRPPRVPGQRNPREVAALLGLATPKNFEQGLLTSGSTMDRKDSYLPLRVVANSSAQTAGPTPANRHHDIGVGRRTLVKVPVSQVVLEAEQAPIEESNDSEKGEQS